MSHDDFERGLVQRRKVLGDAWVNRSLANCNSFNAEFQSLITRYAWNEIWTRPGLDHKTRRFLVLSTVIALGRWEEFELHFRAAVQGGISLDELKEVMMQSAIYAGVPAANTSFALAMKILRELGIEVGPAFPSQGPSITWHLTNSTPQLRYRVEGKRDGPTVVLSHALGCDLSMWDALAEDLAPDYRVVRYDHRGQGGSEVAGGPYTMDQLIEDAARLVHEAAPGPVVWVGVSMGGMVGQGLAARHPELVRGVVIANSTAYYPPEGQEVWCQRIDTVNREGMAGVLDGAMARFFTERFRTDFPDETGRLRAVLAKADAKGYIATCEALRDLDLRAEIPSIRCPALVIAGRQDMGTPLAMSEAIVAAIPGSTLVVIADAAHISPVEQPEAFAGHVRRFLRELEAG